MVTENGTESMKGLAAGLGPFPNIGKVGSI